MMADGNDVVEILGSPVFLRTLVGKDIPLEPLRDLHVSEDNNNYLDVKGAVSPGADTATCTATERLAIVQRNISELLMLTCGISAEHAFRRAEKVHVRRAKTSAQMMRHEYNFTTEGDVKIDTNNEYNTNNKQYMNDSTASDITNHDLANTVLCENVSFVCSEDQSFPSTLTAIQDMRCQVPLLKKEVGILKEKIEVAHRMGLPPSTQSRMDTARYTELQVKIVECELHTTQLESGAKFWKSQASGAAEFRHAITDK
eukprot:m.27420 g.27420  ORF g.27420 m.27420 type:complete len:257 (-) comp15745_c0_seq1:1673-2443(-)